MRISQWSPIKTCKIARRSIFAVNFWGAPLALLIMVSGCAQIPSVREYGESVVRGAHTTREMPACRCVVYSCVHEHHPCEDWSKPDYYLGNGNAVFRQVRNPRCWYHWEVDKNGHIVRWRVESLSGDWWDRNFCDFLPPPGERFSPWFGVDELKN